MARCSREPARPFVDLADDRCLSAVVELVAVDAEAQEWSEMADAIEAAEAVVRAPSGFR